LKRPIFTSNLLVYIAEKILLLNPANFRGDYRCIGRTKGGLNSKLHVVCDGRGKPLAMLLTEWQISDHKGAQIMLGALPPASALIVNKGYDSDWFREALKERGTEPCIPPTRSRKTPLDYD
jgi:hypothetical protein